jgi:hypothetical protein
MDAGVMMMRRTHSPDDENMAKQLLACSVSSLIFTMIPVCLRFYVRLAMIRRFGFDDVILGITAVSVSPLPCRSNKLHLKPPVWIGVVVLEHHRKEEANTS